MKTIFLFSFFGVLVAFLPNAGIAKTLTCETVTDARIYSPREVANYCGVEAACKVAIRGGYHVKIIARYCDSVATCEIAKVKYAPNVVKNYCGTEAACEVATRDKYALHIIRNYCN